MRIFGISDLHLSFSGQKPMDLFGPCWAGHVGKVEDAWKAKVGEGDVVCLPGDFSWAMRLAEVAGELAWLDGLPGTKILIKGNHDYWWDSISKVRAMLPPSVRAIQNDALAIGKTAFAGTRGWIDPALDFSSLSGHAGMDRLGEGAGKINGEEEDRKIFEREVQRLESALSRMDPKAEKRVALIHFPPTSPAMEETRVTAVLEKHRVDAVLFGHLHSICPTEFENPFGLKNGIAYYLVSADFIDFKPVEIATDG